MRSVRLIMKLFTCGLSVALLSFCFLGLTGCAEDNEAAINEQASKTKADTIPADKVSPPISSQKDWAKGNPGLNPASSSSTGVKPRTPAPAAGKG